MPHGKTLELQAIEKPEPEGLCTKCRVPWSTHMTKAGKRRKKYEGDEHQNTAAVTVQGFTLRGTPVGFQGSRQKSLGPPRNKRRKTIVHPIKRERAMRMAKALEEENATKLVQNLKQGRKRG